MELQFKTSIGNVSIQDGFINVYDKKGNQTEFIQISNICRAVIKKTKITLQLACYSEKPIEIIIKKANDRDAFFNLLTSSKKEVKDEVKIEEVKEEKKEK